MIGRAGGTGRYINPFVLQRMEKYLAADALKAGADDLRRVGAVLTAVDGDAAERFQSRNQVLPECIQLFDACIKIFVRLACCHAESDTPRHIFRTGTHALLLAAAKQNRADLDTVADIEESDALRRMDLVSADGKQVNSLFFRTDLIFSICLDRIDMEQCLRIFLLDALADRLDRLYCSDLVIDVHHRHQDRVLADSFFQILQRNMPQMIDRKIGHLKAHLLQK